MAKVAILGAAGGIGQPLSLLLKQSLLISHLALYDIFNLPGVAADLSHVDTPAIVSPHSTPEELPEALKGAKVVVIPAGMPRKPGMTRDELFEKNAGIIRDLATAAAEHCPKAFICIITNPVNSTVPIVSEVFRERGVYDPKRIFGITTLDVVRANAFLSSAISAVPSVNTRIPVIGGHAGITIIPLFSRLAKTTHAQLPQEQIEKLTHRVQYGGDEVVKAKGGAGSATLSMAHAATQFVTSLLRASVEGVSGITEPTYVSLDADPLNGQVVRKEVGGLDYFATEVELGPEGIVRIQQFGELSQYERDLIKTAEPELSNSIRKGVDFIKNSKLD